MGGDLGPLVSNHPASDSQEQAARLTLAEMALRTADPASALRLVLAVLGEECHCIDKASWPEPTPDRLLKPTEALKPIWGEAP